MAEVRLERLTLVHPDGTAALREVSLEVGDGELLLVVGPSGSGKTTLLRLVAGLDRPTGGDVWIGGARVTDLPPGERGVGMVSQSLSLLPHLDAGENLGFPLRVRRLPRPAVEERVGTQARLLGLRSLLRRRPGVLAAGQRQAVALGRATIDVPRVLLLDEPLNHVDASRRAALRRELLRYQRSLAVTTLWVTNDVVEALACGARVCVLHDGEVQQTATPERLYHEPANTLVARSAGDPAMNLVEGVLAAGRQRAWVRAGDHSLAAPLTDDVRRLDGRRVVLGMRAEDLRPARPTDGWYVEAEVRRVTRLGSHTLVEAALAGAGGPVAVVARVGAAGPVAVVAPVGADDDVPAGAVRLTGDPSRFHVFDALTGAAIHHPAGGG